MAYDVRAIANVVLDRSDRQGAAVTNLSLNKVLYFVHGYFLAHFGKPLIREQPEAWEWGPVYREIYRQFRDFEREPITTRTKRLDFGSGRMVPFDDKPSEIELQYLIPVVDFYVKMPAWKLVELSHLPGSPWEKTWNHSSPSNPGMIIPDEMIESYFKSLSAAKGGGVG
jgi:uncharacterized phage-associated protein